MARIFPVDFSCTRTRRRESVRDMTNTDSLKRDDMQTPSAFEAFEALAPAMRQSLRRAASRGTASLPHELGEGWIMVPLRKGRRQVAYKGARAWGL